jgi:hypothetical protein
MQIQYCSICSTSFDYDEEGDKGMIGLIPFALCGTCKAGVWDYAQQSFDLIPRPEAHLKPCGCERGGDCDKVTRCHMNEAINELIND